jgi:hypothetical protein
MILLIYAPPHDMSTNAPDPTLNLAFQSLVIRGMSGYARLKVRGLLTKSNRKKFLQRPMKATKRTATSLTFPFALFAFLNMARWRRAWRWMRSTG